MKRIIITGASDGLGLEIAKIFLEKDFEIINISRSKPENEKIIHLETDLTNQLSIENTTNLIKEKYSDFEYLVHMAGIFSQKPIEKLNFDEMNKLFNTNTSGLMYFTSQLFPLIKINSTDILIGSSRAAYGVGPNESVYSASKFALRSFAESLRLELVDTTCRVTHFAPGGIQTNFAKKFSGEYPQKYPLYMDPKSVARVAVFVLETPKEMEITEIIINKKKK